jgi:transposase InsO family protein
VDRSLGERPPRPLDFRSRDVKEQCLYLHRFTSLTEARAIIGAFIARYNAEWLIERLGHRTPAAARAAALAA